MLEKIKKIQGINHNQFDETIQMVIFVMLTMINIKVVSEH